MTQRSALPVADAGADQAASAPGRKIWDLPTRVFHWGLAAAVTGAIVSAQLGGNWMDWHFRLGVVTLGLLGFRLVWGCVGPRYANFASFLYRPSEYVEHFRTMRSAKASHAGHSPSGVLSVVAMLVALLLQALAGLFSSDSIGVEGPLAHLASEADVSLATRLHAAMQWPIYLLVLLHVAAVLIYLLVKREDLIGPMLNGYKRGVRAPDANDSLLIRALGLAALVAAIVLGLWWLR